jgi:hypothetical protein
MKNLPSDEFLDRKVPCLGMLCVNVFVRDQDASLLIMIMPLVFFMAPTDPRMHPSGWTSTISDSR